MTDVLPLSPADDGSQAQAPLTIVVPLYNEAGNILPLIEEISAALDGIVAYEILLIDDGSSDKTAEEMALAAQRNQAVRTLFHRARSGKSAALWSALNHVRTPWVQMLDGDRQNDPADVAKLWQEVFVPAPPDRLGIVAGQRNRRNDGAVKMLSSRIANAVRRTLLSDGTPDTGCGFKMIRTEAFRAVPFFDGMHRFLPALVRRAGWEVMQFRVNDRARTHGVSKYGFFGRLGAGIVDLLGVVWLIKRGTFGTIDTKRGTIYERAVGAGGASGADGAEPEKPNERASFSDP
ncbi:MAG: glycosyltransferase family 2 protein [Pseudomonadota bacterium]